ncbi:Ribonuclease III domain-containing protein RNC1, chloroplastic, partial [Cucurbita argyrosperma subsp. argyrosperma]
MELSSSFVKLSSSTNYSFSSSFTPFIVKIHPNSPNFPNPTSGNLRIFAVAVDPQQELPKNNPQRLLKELAERKRATSPKKKVPPRRYILRPPLDDKKLAERFLNSPQLTLKSFPLLSSCLPSSRLNNADKTWMDEYLLEAKQALGYPLEPSDTSLMRKNKGTTHKIRALQAFVFGAIRARIGVSRRYPRESPGPMRKRVFALIGKRNLPKWIKAASLQNLIFPYDDMDKLIRKDQVYRVLFEVFGMDPDSEECEPRLRRQLEDVDYVSVDCRQVLNQMQLCLLHPSKYKFEHPRFCYERLEYLGPKIQVKKI